LVLGYGGRKKRKEKKKTSTQKKSAYINWVRNTLQSIFKDFGCAERTSELEQTTNEKKKIHASREGGEGRFQLGKEGVKAGGEGGSPKREEKGPRVKEAFVLG